MPSITGYPVYVGQLDELLEPFRETVGERECARLVELLLVNIDRTLPDAFVHANLGPRDTPIGRLVLETERRLCKAVPNLSLKLSPETPDAFFALAIETALDTGKPYFVYHEAVTSVHGEYGIASCYNSLRIGGGSHTLVRANLKEIAKRSDGRSDFFSRALPEAIDALCEVIDTRARYVVEEARFFEGSFLAREGLIDLAKFTSMAGIFGLHECVEILAGGLCMGKSEEARRASATPACSNDRYEAVAEAVVHKIIEHTLIDGPGSRMAYFLQGCDLACIYCHNPETQRHCTHCAACVEACPEGALAVVAGRVVHDVGRCADCGRCVATCELLSSPKCRRLTAEEALSEILPFVDFLDGVTLSGGERTLQADFIVELATLLHARTKLTLLVDTNGNTPAHDFERLAASVDGLLFDLKALDPDVHMRLTGHGNARVLENLTQASMAGRLCEVRTVFFAGHNERDEDVLAMARLLRALGGTSSWKLLPFRPDGVRTSLASEGGLPAARLAAIHALASGVLGPRVAPLTASRHGMTRQ